ncbi:MAG: hypothetical protein OXC12_07460 [Spirochaetaceae bacterium]|nr:hypothetical protein [Spirochaetaceae bacterium]
MSLTTMRGAYYLPPARWSTWRTAVHVLNWAVDSELAIVGDGARRHQRLGFLATITGSSTSG